MDIGETNASTLEGAGITVLIIVEEVVYPRLWGLRRARFTRAVTFAEPAVAPVDM